MLEVKVVKSTSANALEKKINEALQSISEDDFIDLKFAGAYDGKDESFVATIIYRR